MGDKSLFAPAEYNGMYVSFELGNNIIKLVNIQSITRLIFTAFHEARSSINEPLMWVLTVIINQSNLMTYDGNIPYHTSPI